MKGKERADTVKEHESGESVEGNKPKSPVAKKQHMPLKSKSKTFSRRSKWTRGDGEMITRDEWFAKTPQEKANYFNNSRMPINEFAFKMFMFKHEIIDDFERNNYCYDKLDHKYKTILKWHLDRWEAVLYHVKSQKNYLKVRPYR